MHKFVARLKEQTEENPIAAIGVGAAAAAAAAKLIDAVGSVRSKNAYAKKMNPKKSKR